MQTLCEHTWFSLRVDTSLLVLTFFRSASVLRQTQMDVLFPVLRQDDRGEWSAVLAVTLTAQKEGEGEVEGKWR